MRMRKGDKKVEDGVSFVIQDFNPKWGQFGPRKRDEAHFLLDEHIHKKGDMTFFGNSV